MGNNDHDQMLLFIIFITQLCIFTFFASLLSSKTINILHQALKNQLDAVAEWNFLIANANVSAVNSLPGPVRPTESLIQRAILHTFVSIATQSAARRRALTK